MRRNLVIPFLCAAALLVAGCDTKPLSIPDPGAPDVPADVPGEVAPDVPVVDDALHDAVVPVAYIPAASFRFVSAGRDGEAFVIDVVARDFKATFGMALRVEWDPAALALVSARPAAIFGDEAAGEAVYRAAEIRPGSLALGLTHLYYLAATALPGDVVVATLKVKSLNGTPADLRFFAPRCLLMDGDRAPIDATYLTATLNP
jgi:hypothetical protein